MSRIGDGNVNCQNIFRHLRAVILNNSSTYFVTQPWHSYFFTQENGTQGCYPGERTYSRMCPSAFIIIAPYRSQPKCPPAGEGIQGLL